MSERIKLVLLYGGKSGEHEISLISAASVLANLNPEQYEVIPIGMDKEGKCYLNTYESLLSFKEALPVSTALSQPLNSLLENGRFPLAADVVFPVVHGPLYEDGCLQGLLQLANIAYVGCSVLTSAIGMDKDIARRICAREHIKSARYQLLSWHTSKIEVEQFCQQVVAEFGWPLFVKPCSMGSSVGIHKANNHKELLEAISDAKRYAEEILVEENIEGREIELAVLENSTSHLPPKVSIAGEIKVHHPDGFYSYSAKYLESEQTALVVPAVVSTSLLTRLQNTAAQIFTALKCKGMARVDFFVDEKSDTIYFNEINTIPGFTSISMYPKLWEASGIAYGALLDTLINMAIKNHQKRQQLVTHYQ